MRQFGPVSPVLDRLAARGIKFTQGYSKFARVLATRFAMITARYQYRLARRGRRADQQQAPWAPRSACQRSIRRCPPCCARRAIGPRSSASGTWDTRRPSVRCARGMRSSSGRCPAASTTSLIATRPASTTCGFGEEDCNQEGYPHRSALEACRRLCRSHGATGRALLPQPASTPHTALALGNAR